MASAPISAPLASDLDTVASFLARRDVNDLFATRADVIVLCGSDILGTADLAARAIAQGVAPLLLVTGGIGHSTPNLRRAVASHPIYGPIVPVEARTEADILVDILVVSLGVPREKVVVERESTNCGTNSEFTRRTLEALPGGLSSFRRILMLQDPMTSQRALVTFEHWWRKDPAASAELLSFAPFVPRVVPYDGTGSGAGAGAVSSSSTSVVGAEVPSDTAKQYGFVLDASGFSNVWFHERFLSLLLGEIPRLRDDEKGYGPRGKGFIGHVDIPQKVEEAHARIALAFPALVGR
jgi:hypothetical protein